MYQTLTRNAAIAALLLCTTTALAEPADSHLQYPEPSSAEKATSTDNRLLSHSIIRYNGTATYLVDSFIYQYSGTRSSAVRWNDIDADFDEMTWLQYKPATGTFVNFQHTVRTYDAADNITNSLLESWVPSSGTWTPRFNTINTYSSTNKITESLIMRWDVPSASWINNQRTQYTYDATDRLSTATTTDWYGASWENTYRMLYSYSGSSTLPYDNVYQDWETGSGIWVDQTKEKYTYSGAGELQTMMRFTINTLSADWDTTSNTEYTDHSSGQPQTGTTQTWNVHTHEYRNSTRQKYSYNADGQPGWQVNYDWQVASGTWDTTTSGQTSVVRYYYGPQVAVQQIQSTSLLLHVWPVPADKQISVQVPTQMSGAISLYITDATGRSVLRQSHTACNGYTLLISTALLSPGNYLLRMTDGSKTATTKVSIIR